MTHHPHVHMIVPGGGLSEDGTRWIACRPNFLLAVRVLSRLFRRLVLQMLIAAHEAGRLQFFGAHAALADTKAFATFLVPLRRLEWVVYSKRPFEKPAQLQTSRQRPGDKKQADKRQGTETNFTAPCRSASAAAAVRDDPSCIERGSARGFL